MDGPPTRLTRFFGRRAETSELRGLVPATRLLTLAGPAANREREPVPHRDP